ncbi:hypothetical protein JCM3770_002440 [Rhodotorula araucariae]
MSAFSAGPLFNATGSALAHFVLARSGGLFPRSEEFEPARGDPQNASLYAGAGTFEEATHELFSVVTEVNIVHLAIVILSLFITFFGLFSGFVKERLYVGEAIIATCFGIAFSGYAAGIFAPRTWSDGHHTDEITLELTRIVIALSVFAVGVELPKAYVWRHWRGLSILLGPIMLLGWMVSAGLMYAIIPGLEFLPALVLAAAVTPTDPILASSVVGKGKYAQEHVPSHIRHILQAESGCNDGAAFPFLYLALFLLLRGDHSVGSAIGYWIVLVLLYQIVLGIIIGAAVGIIARKILKFSKRRELIDRESMVAMYVALALLVTGLTTLAGSDDLLAAFACGTAFAWDDWFTESIEESNFSSTVDLLANCAIFIYIGATMPFNAWQSETTTLTWWRMLLLCLGILALRRLPTMYALYHWIPDIKTRREAIFAGHFGPMGVGAIFISTLAAEKLPTPSIPPTNSVERLSLMIVPVTYCIVLSSILVHGLSISFFTLGRRVHSRVASFSRTLTAQSSRSGFGRTFSFGGGAGGTSGRGAGAGGRGGARDDEPSWMSRVKRATRAEDIVINRDDDESPESLAEKGVGVGRPRGSLDGDDEKRAFDEREEEEEEAEEVVDHAAAEAARQEGHTPTPSEIEREVEREVEVDEGDLAMFGAPPSAKVGAGKKEQLIQERRAARERGERGEDADAPGDREEDVAERGGTDVEKEVETASDIQRGRHRAAEHRGEMREEHRREMDDNPPRNILADDGDDASDSASAKAHFAERNRLGKGKEPERGRRSSRSASPVPMSKRNPKLEARYCRGTKTWQEGRKIIVDHGNGDVDVIDMDASPEAARKASAHPQMSVFTVPDDEIEAQRRVLTEKHGPGEHDANAVKRVAAKMLRQGSAVGARLKPREEGGSAEEKERRRREKLERDAWCRRERKYRDSSSGCDYEEWIEGDKVVTKHANGKITVRELTAEEKRRKAKKHLDALRALGHPAEALEAEFARLARTLSGESRRNSIDPTPSTSSTPAQARGFGAAQTPAASPPRGRSADPTPSPHPEPRFTASPARSISPERAAEPPRASNADLSLFRSERIDPPSDDDDVAAVVAASPASISGPARPVPARQGSTAIQAMRELFRPRASAPRTPLGPSTATSSRDESPTREDSGDSNGAGPSIRFAAVDRPQRDGSTGTGRALPVVGSSLSVRRTPSKRTGEA